mgnify:CR=1 FL=1
MGVIFLMMNLLTLAALMYFRVAAKDLEIENNILLTRATELKLRVLLLTKSSRNLPDTKKLGTLRDDIGKINMILAKHEYDANSALEALEKNAPKHVYLQRLKHDSETGKIIFRAIAKKNSNLTEFLKKLEQEKLFKHVSLLRKDNIKEAGKLYHRVEIELEQINLASGKV